MGGGGEGKDGRMRGGGAGGGGTVRQVRRSVPHCAAVRHSAPNRVRSATTEAASSQKARKTPKISQRHRLVASRSAARILVASRLLAAPPAICLQSRGFAALRLLAAPPRLAAFAAPVKFRAHLPEPCTYA